MSLLQVENLSVTFNTFRGALRAVDNVSFTLNESETLGIVGESGSGKSVSSLALMGLLPNLADVAIDRFSFDGRDILKLNGSERRKIIGRDISMIFQDPMTSLNPSLSVKFQLMEVIKRCDKLNRKARYQRAVSLLEQVGIDDSERVLLSYPHELSGGMSQRVMIAMAIAGRPKLLIADEPTTALDVTIQAQILDLIKSLQKDLKMALILITHDIAVVSQMAEKTIVMYGGQMVEGAATSSLISFPTHPYTENLLACLPGENSGSRLQTIPGLVPDLVSPPSGCRLHPRCKYATEECQLSEPSLHHKNQHETKCHYPLGVRLA